MRAISLTQVLTVVVLVVGSGHAQSNDANANSRDQVTFGNTPATESLRQCGAGITQINASFQDSVRKFNEVCSKFGSNAKDCFEQAITCADKAKTEKGISEGSVNAEIKRALAMAPQLGGAAANMNMALEMTNKQNNYKNNVCQKTSYTKQDLQSRYDNLKREIEADFKEGERNAETFRNRVKDINDERKELAKDQAKEAEDDQKANNQAIKDRNDADKERMKAEMDTEKQKIELVNQYRKMLRDKSKVDRMQNRKIFEVAIRKCMAETIKAAPRSRIHMGQNMFDRSVCVETAKMQYNDAIEEFKEQDRMLEMQFKQLQLQENNRATAEYAARIQRETEQAQRVTMGQMKATKATMDKLRIDQDEVNLKMQQSNQTNRMMLQSVNKNLELNRLSDAIANYGNPVDVSPREVSAAFVQLESDTENLNNQLQTLYATQGCGTNVPQLNVSFLGSEAAKTYEDWVKRMERKPANTEVKSVKGTDGG